jgi:hypothetical protein
MAFNLPPLISKKEQKTFKKLSRACCEVDLLTDDLFVMDANSVADDARYFVFGVCDISTSIIHASIYQSSCGLLWTIIYVFVF